MEISAACYESGWLKLKVSANDAFRWLAQEFKPRNYDIVPHTEKRSKNANAFAWSMINQIANKLQIPSIDVYRHAIENIGGRQDIVRCEKNAYEDFERAFTAGHIGRKFEIIGETEKMYDILVTYGSSDYNTREMSALLDSILQECQELGIPTPEDERIQSLIDDWGRRYYRE